MSFIDVFADFPVLPYKGTKSIVISTVSWIGGKNPFLGWAYVAAAAVFVLLAIAGTARHVIKPRFVRILRILPNCTDALWQTSGRHVTTLVESIDESGGT